MRVIRLEDGLNFGVNGDVGLREPIDLETFAGLIFEMKEAADKVILIKNAERALRFLERKPQ